MHYRFIIHCTWYLLNNDNCIQIYCTARYILYIFNLLHWKNQTSGDCPFNEECVDAGSSVDCPFNEECVAAGRSVDCPFNEENFDAGSSVDCPFNEENVDAGSSVDSH